MLHGAQAKGLVLTPQPGEALKVEWKSMSDSKLYADHAKYVKLCSDRLSKMNPDATKSASKNTK